MNKQFFVLTPSITYSIECIGCSRGLGPYKDDTQLERQATKDGWLAVQTQDEGTENYCPDCKDLIKIPK